jgi:1-acyl-sn-glycerol-3-phosphate acyltransferase
METAEVSERRPVRYWVGRVVLTALGWREEGVVPDVDKYVLIAAPHTSNWDLPITLGIGYTLGIDIVWIGKHTLFTGPLGPFYRWLGGIPVDRRASQDQVQVLASLFDVEGKRIMVVAPEGTRAKLRYWKSGFYWIARTAKVPIGLGYLDFRRKRGGVGPMIHPSDDVDADVARIHEFYERITAKFPEEFSNIEFRPAGESAERPKRHRPGVRGKISGLLHGMGWT